MMEQGRDGEQLKGSDKKRDRANGAEVQAMSKRCPRAGACGGRPVQSQQKLKANGRGWSAEIRRRLGALGRTEAPRTAATRPPQAAGCRLSQCRPEAGAPKRRHSAEHRPWLGSAGILPALGCAASRRASYPAWCGSQEIEGDGAARRCTVERCDLHSQEGPREPETGGRRPQAA
jgi:hypothetical protein